MGSQLLTAYPAQWDHRQVGTNAFVYPYSLDGRLLVGRIMRYDDVRGREARVVVRVGGQFYLTNVASKKEFEYNRDSQSPESPLAEVASLTGLLPPQDPRFLNRIADIRPPGEEDCIIHGRYVRADLTGNRTVLILSDEPTPRIFTNLEVSHNPCTGPGCGFDGRTTS